MTTRDLMRSSRRFQSAEQAERALQDLEAAGWGRLESRRPGPSGGRPSKQFQLAGTVDVDKTPDGDGLTGGSVTVNTVNASGFGAEDLERHHVAAVTVQCGKRAMGRLAAGEERVGPKSRATSIDE